MLRTRGELIVRPLLSRRIVGVLRSRELRSPGGDMRAAVTVVPNVIEFANIDESRAPGANELLVRPGLVGVCGSDIHFFSGELAAASATARPFPRIQGYEFAGIVDAVGAAPARRLQLGERMPVVSD
jgi:L-gulonate 5-dehydrogenase